LKKVAYADLVAMVAEESGPPLSSRPALTPGAYVLLDRTLAQVDAELE
jgi:hypothetical protein